MGRGLHLGARVEAQRLQQPQPTAADQTLALVKVLHSDRREAGGEDSKNTGRSEEEGKDDYKGRKARGTLFTQNPRQRTKN